MSDKLLISNIFLGCVLLAFTILSGCSDDTVDQDVKGDVNDDVNTGFVHPDEWYEDAIFYEIFVRSFYDSDGDGIGDLPGIIEKFDYLNDGVPGEGSDLEIDGLWLMPIFKTTSYHGYDVTDYLEINPEYGTVEDFKNLLELCHEREVKVILDLVVNHTSSSHPWFLEAQEGSDSNYRNYYHWNGDLTSFLIIP